METASITEAKNRFSALIDKVKSGSPVLIVDRGCPVARLEPVSIGGPADTELARLVREGLVRPPRRPLPRAFFKARLPRLKKRASVLASLLEERREER